MALFGANNTSDDLVVGVRWARQRPAPGVGVVDDVLVVVGLRSMPIAAVARVHADELGTTRVARVAGHDVPRVLLGPPGRADVGSGYHDGGGT